MAHDPCSLCGEQTGFSSDNREILVDGDAPATTFCSYECLASWAEGMAADRYMCTWCGATYWEHDIEVDGLGPVCPSCDRRKSRRIQE